MYYVYSTATCSGCYPIYEETGNKDLSVIKKRPDGTPISILIHGGHGVADKFMYTPRGVATKVSDEDMEILLAHPMFLKHMKAGYMSYEKKNVDPEKKAASMKEKDGSYPLTPSDFEESENSTRDNKIYKKKGFES